jgi:hypothetical protein
VRDGTNSDEGDMNTGFLSIKNISRIRTREGSQFHEGDMNPGFLSRIFLGSGKGGLEPIPTKSIRTKDFFPEYSYTAKEGPVRIQQKCMVPMYVFP